MFNKRSQKSAGDRTVALTSDLRSFSNLAVTY